MSVIVNTQNEQEEKILLAFLDSLCYKYQQTSEDPDKITGAFLDRYNKELEDADADIESGNFVSHEEVEKLLGVRG